MEYINILSIDPGTNMGVSIYTVSVPDLKILSIVTTVLNLSNHTTEDPFYDNLLLRTQVIQRYIGNLTIEYMPHVLAMEAAFVNSKFPKSVMYLSHYIAAINLSVTSINPFIKIFNYPPKLVKKLISNTGNADKDAMKVAVAMIPEITNHLDVNYLSEHEIDSLAIGYACIEELRNNPVLLLML